MVVVVEEEEEGWGGEVVVQDRIPTLAAYKALTLVSCYWSTNLQVMLCTDWRLSSYRLDTPRAPLPSSLHVCMESGITELECLQQRRTCTHKGNAK